MRGNSYVPFMLRRGDGSTLSLDFTSMSSLDSRFTFSRSSATSTYINSSGLVTTAGTNVPRFDYDPTTLAPRGLLIEGSATNLIYWSETFDTTGAAINWNWTASNVTRGTVTTTNPTGSSATVVKIQETTANGVHCPLIVYSTLTSSAYTASVFAKAVERQYLQLFDNGGSAAYAMFNLSGIGTVVSESTPGIATITPYPNGWYRITMRTPTLTNLNLQLRLSTDGTTTSYAGTLNSGLYIWGAQLEAGSGASSYIPTGASQVQRAVDEMTMANIAALNFNQSGGTVFMQVEGNPRNRDTFPYFAAFEQSPSGRGWSFLRLNNTSGGVLRMLGTAFNTSLTTGITSSNHTRPSGRFKFATTLEPTVARTTYVIAGGSALVDTASAFTLPTIGSLKFNNTTETAATDFTSVWISQLKYWPTVLTNAQLQAITA